MFSTAVLGMADLRFLADAAIIDDMVQLQRKEEGEKKGTSRAGKIDGLGEKEEENEVQRLCDMLCDDIAHIVFRSSK